MLWPLYRSGQVIVTCTGQHPLLKTYGFWKGVLQPTRPCQWQLLPLDYGEDKWALFSGATHTIAAASAVL